jgi:primosomal protein N' (replication factor Y)
VEVVRPVPGRRVWPLVEVVDRREEPPGSGVVTERVKAALRAVLRSEGRAFVFTHRRGYAPASRCVSCRQVLRCARCGSRPDPGTHCRRCGAELGPCPTCGGRRFEPLGAAVGRVAEELRRVLGERAVAEVPEGAPVQVGTERDLVQTPTVDLAVVVDADGLILGSDYRAGEEALRVMARLACRLRPGSGRRMMVQTSLPEHPVVAALRRGDPIPYLTEEVAERARLGYPPAAELMVVEVRGGEDADQLDRGLRELSPPSLLGPATTPQGRRWLVQGRDLTGFRRQLRSLVQRWRETGLTVRVDVDPIDL